MALKTEKTEYDAQEKAKLEDKKKQITENMKSIIRKFNSWCKSRKWLTGFRKDIALQTLFYETTPDKIDECKNEIKILKNKISEFEGSLLKNIFSVTTKYANRIGLPLVGGIAGYLIFKNMIAKHFEKNQLEYSYLEELLNQLNDEKYNLEKSLNAEKTDTEKEKIEKKLLILNTEIAELEAKLENLILSGKTDKKNQHGLLSKSLKTATGLAVTILCSYLGYRASKITERYLPEKKTIEENEKKNIENLKFNLCGLKEKLAKMLFFDSKNKRDELRIILESDENLENLELRDIDFEKYQRFFGIISQGA